jgi:hypothetical protein
MMKLLLSRFRWCFVLVVLSGVGLAAYATLKVDPLEKRYGEVEWVVFGDGSGGSGLFALTGESTETPTISMKSNPAYDHAIQQVRSLKELIEQEAVRRSEFSDRDSRFEVLLGVISKYIELQKIFYLNYLANLHENKVQAGAFRVDDLNLELNSRIGFQLVLRKELQQKFHVRHREKDSRSGEVELFLPPYERTQLEAAALGRIKTKMQYQKFLHFSFLRDSLVNRWALKRVVPALVSEGITSPPRGYDSFLDDQAGKPSEYAFSRDLGVEDRYETRIKAPILRLRKALSDIPIGSEDQYRDLVQEYYRAFSQFENFPMDPGPMVANLFDLEERALQNVTEQIVLEGSFPQDDLTPDAIARRTARNAFQVRKAGILKVLLQKVKIDLAVWNYFAEPDDDGMVSEDAFLKASQYMKIPEADLARASRVVDSRLDAWEGAWIERMADRIRILYRDVILPEEKLMAGKRHEEFLRQTLKTAGLAMSHLKQRDQFDSIKTKFDRISPYGFAPTERPRVPLEVHCYPGIPGGGALSANCVTRVSSDLFLSGLDARADVGMSWVIPWTVDQIRAILESKIRLMEDSDPSRWEEIKNVIRDPGIEYFFEELGILQQKEILSRKSALEAEKMLVSKRLADYMEKNPGTVLEEADLYREMTRIQERIESVGIDHRESALTEGIYEAAAHAAFARRIEDLYVKLPRTLKEIEQEHARESEELRRVRTITVPDALRTADARESYEKKLMASCMGRETTMVQLAKVFKLLGFGDDFFARYKPSISGYNTERMANLSFEFETRYPKPDAETLALFGGLLRNDPREGRGSALSEVARSARSQHDLAKVELEKVYLKAPFLRIRAGEDEKAKTGLERLASAFSPVTGWNQAKARVIFDALIRTAVRNDSGKVEDAVLARPDLPEQDPRYQKIFKSQSVQRSLLQASASVMRKNEVASWDEDLRLQTRTPEEVWNDRFIKISLIMMIPLAIFILWEMLPAIIPAFGFQFSTATAVFSGFTGGPLLLGVLNGSNFLVQLFFISTIATQGHVAFFTLPAQMQYEREIANSTVGLTGKSVRVLLPSERVSMDQLSVRAEEVRSAKLMTGLGAALQIVFLPNQVKSFLRWSGEGGRTALHSLGRTSPGIVQKIEAPSLSALVKQHGYSKGSLLYLERYRTAVATGRPVSAVNGSAGFLDAQKMLANSLASKFQNSTEFAAFLEARLARIREDVVSLEARANKYFRITQGGDASGMEEKIRLYIGKELASIRFHLQRPGFRIGVRKSFRYALLRGEFTTIEEGTEKYLMKAFILRKEAETLMAEAKFLRGRIHAIRAMDASAGETATADLFLDFTHGRNLGILDDLLDWGSHQQHYSGTPFGESIEEAAKASSDFKIVARDISGLPPRDQEAFQGMNGNVDVLIGEDLRFHPGSEAPASGEKIHFYLMPGSYLHSNRPL